MHQGCSDCGNSNNVNRCGKCDECSAADNLAVCQAVQIEQLKNRTDQLKAQIECVNTGEPFDTLCEIQSCELPECVNTGTTCDGKSPTRRPVGSKGFGCEESNLKQDCCDKQAKQIRKLQKDVTKLQRQFCEIKSKAIKEVLLDAEGNVRGGFNLEGRIVNFTAGSWEAAVAAAGD